MAKRKLVKKKAAKKKTAKKAAKKTAAKTDDREPLTCKAAKELVAEFQRQVKLSGKRYYDFKPTDVTAGAEILKLSDVDQVTVLGALLVAKPDGLPNQYALDNLCGRVLRRKLPLTADVATKASTAFLGTTQRYGDYADLNMLGAIERFAEINPLPDKVVDNLRKAIERLGTSQKSRQTLSRINTLLGEGGKPNMHTGEAWSDVALADIEKMKDEKRSAWNSLLAHCETAAGGKPNAKWIDAAKPLFKKVGAANFKKHAVKWFSFVDKPRTVEITSWSEWGPNPNLMLNEANAAVLKGMVWCCEFCRDESVARALAPLAITAYKKVPGIGPRAVALGNACVYLLGTFTGIDGVAQLAILKVRVKFGTAQKGIEKALVATAEREGIPRDELEEMSVPAYGLTEVGSRSESLGDFTAELVIAGRKAELRWLKPDGAPQKSMPAAVKKDFAEDVKELKQAAKDIEKMIPAQAARLEQTYLQQRQWEFAVWQERYLDHPLVGALTRGLIWHFTKARKKASGIFRDGKFVGRDGKKIDWIGKGAGVTVKLWHPLDESSKAITAWREWLEMNEIKQPFKQAHREIYILTDAEKKTKTYSNRFAAHVLKQHQYNALCAARGWKNSLRLLVDDDFPPTHLVMPAWELRAEYWVEGAGTEYGDDTNETGTFYYLTTDQVRFYRTDAQMSYAHASGGGYQGRTRGNDRPLELSKIPKLVFSEVMRDVDLFVGVSSVANDPTWSDGGPRGRYQDYWQSHSFGNLGATAHTRKDVLQRLIPRLAIADRCSFTDRFLVVQGEIRTYKIHLGSGNILMEPNDQYLCIVAKQSVGKGSDKVFLPFEGDNMMSIILSKALLLADDKKIKDKTIISQIK